MKTLKNIGLWLLGILVVFTLAAYLMPKTYKVERGLYIHAKPAVIYHLTSNFLNWPLWMPWTSEVDSTVIFQFKGEDGLPGAEYSWNGEILGNGTMIATTFLPDTVFGYDLAFDQGKYQSKGRITTMPGDSCLVKWTDQGDLGYNPVSRYMGLFMGLMMGPDFEKGLRKLKRVAELRNNWPPITETVIPAQTVVFIKDSAGPNDFAGVMARAYQELYKHLRSANLKQSGAPFATYLKWDSVTYFAVMNICIPVERAEQGKGRINVVQIPQQRVVKAVWFGAYDKTEPVYRALDGYVKAAGLTEAGGPSEIFITSPVTEPDTNKWETHIVFPVK